MKLKGRPNDFRVSELLEDGFLRPRGPHRVYRVKKRKLTSEEARRELARLAGVEPRLVAMAGLKDRQGIATQFMSIPRGKGVAWEGQDLVIENAGFSDEPIDGSASRGNAFSIVVRDLAPAEVAALRDELAAVRRHGLPNYFDEQRFGNLRHQQGWIVLELARGRTENALRRLLTAVSPFDDERQAHFKSALYRHWGDWRACREVAGKFGAHHSLFEHLKRDPRDFAGAFRRVPLGTRLIHLYAFQSHLWNRAVSRWVEERLPRAARFGVRGIEGVLGFPREEVPVPEAWEGSFPLAGAKLAGVRHPDQHRLYEGVLERVGLQPERLQVQDVPGFGLKSEERMLVLRPRELRARPARPDPERRGRELVRLTFELPRGSYATLVVRRLLGAAPPSRDERRPPGKRPARR